MLTSQDVNRIIDTGNNEVMSAIFKDLITEHDKVVPAMQEKWNQYDGDVPILNRKMPIGTPDYKSNNKMRNDFRDLIVDQGITYTFGKPIATVLTDEVKSNQKIVTTLQDFKRRNDIDDLDLQTALRSAICGTASRLAYIDLKGDERVMDIAPWETVFIYDKTTDLLEYAMIYYKVELINVRTGQKQKVTYVEWYDRQNVFYFIEDRNRQGFFILDTAETKNPMPHGFEGVPLIEFPNNDLRKGDFDRVTDLIDGYDRMISDSQNELEDFRNAYMVFKGLVPDEETMKNAKVTGAIGSEDENFDASFLTKDLTGTFHENHKKTLNENIYKFSKRIDFQSDKLMSGAVSGTALARMLQALENDAVMKERKFTRAMRYQYLVIASAWQRKNIPFDYLSLNFQFTRNLPVDLEYYGTVLTAYFGKIPMKILYSLLPFIDDPEKAIQMLEEENRSKGIDLNNIDENGNPVKKNPPEPTSAA